MQQGRGAADLVEVRDAAHDVADVLEEPEARQDVGACLGEQDAVEQYAGQNDQANHEGHGRPDAGEPAAPETRKRPHARPCTSQQGGGDQVSGEDEQHHHAHVSAG